MKANTPYALSHRDVAGFTLIELVVALAVTAMLSTLVFQSLDLGRRALTKASGTNSRIEETLSLHRALRSKLQQIIPLQSKSISSNSQRACGGDQKSISFVAPAPGAEASAAYQIDIGDSSGRTALTIGWCVGVSINGSCTTPGAASQEVVLDRFDRAQFDYFVTNREGQKGRWQDSWTDCAHPPSLIRLRIAFAEGDSRNWPDLVVRPRLAAGADCKFDPVSIACRVL